MSEQSLRVGRGEMVLTAERSPSVSLTRGLSARGGHGRALRDHGRHRAEALHRADHRAHPRLAPHVCDQLGRDRFFVKDQ